MEEAKTLPQPNFAVAYKSASIVKSQIELYQERVDRLEGAMKALIKICKKHKINLKEEGFVESYDAL